MDTHFFLIIFLFVVAPVIIIYLESKYSLAKKIGAVLICYGLGIFIGNVGILPEISPAYHALVEGSVYIPFAKMREYLAEGLVTQQDVSRNTISFLQDLFSSIPIMLCLPLILFSLDVKKWMRQAKEAVGSLIIGLFTVLLMVFVGFWMFRGSIEEIWKVSGMLVGVYTGGTPNMAAIKTALNVSQEIYILTHTYEMTLGAIYLVFIFTIGQKVFLWFLPPYKSQNSEQIETGEIDIAEDYDSYDGLFRKDIFWPLLGAFGISVGILGVSFLLSKLFSDDFANAAVVILVTTFGIGLSFVPRIRRIKKTFQLGMYLILIFCVAVASMADISKLADISISLFYYVGIAMFGSHLLHALIARFFKIDADTVIISGSALICSPPFVPVVATALKNREVILTGMFVGIAGYAVGNYLGVIVAYILK
ncbi:DUF819 family protein [Maribellus sp. YY47]|uniref:DUF819 family protein n=1 Tax=Maribellus sp. YY47 TaxID=2929486 RepID=UPI002000902B|nr:DUF819 family protein [Maribellus sp. YY47]MCK3686254.1 DUF819 family protein [Maribellus sp. YY47]